MELLTDLFSYPAPISTSSTPWWSMRYLTSTFQRLVWNVFLNIFIMSDLNLQAHSEILIRFQPLYRYSDSWLNGPPIHLCTSHQLSILCGPTGKFIIAIWRRRSHSSYQRKTKRCRVAQKGPRIWCINAPSNPFWPLTLVFSVVPTKKKKKHKIKIMLAIGV